MAASKHTHALPQWSHAPTIIWQQSNNHFETICSQAKMTFPHSTLGLGRKVCHHSELHSFIVDPMQEEEGLVSTFIKLAAFRMNFPTTNHIVEKNLQLQHQKTGWGIGWGIGWSIWLHYWQLHFTVNHKF